MQSSLHSRLEIAVARRIAAGQSAPEVIEAADRIVGELGCDDAAEIRDAIEATAWWLDPRPDEVSAILEACPPESEPAPAASSRPLALLWAGAGLDEQASRTSAWTEGQWIALADGQRWSFPAIPLPKSADEPFKVDPGLLGDLMLLRLAPDAATTFGRLFDVATTLLQAQYHLTREDCQALIPIESSDPGFVRRVDEAESADTPFLAMVCQLRDHIAPAVRELDRRHGPSRQRARLGSTA